MFYNRSAELEKHISLGVEASYYLFPESPGLTYVEIVELCKRYDFKNGEIREAFNKKVNSGDLESYFNTDIITLSKNYIHFVVPWQSFKESNFRNLKIMDRIIKTLVEEVRERGQKQANLSILPLQTAIVEEFQCSVLEFKRNLKLLEMYGFFEAAEGIIKNPSNRLNEKFAQTVFENRSFRNDEELFKKIFHTVEDLVDRRSDSRPLHADPFEAFEGLLIKLDAKNLKIWWKTTSNELKQLDSFKHTSSKITVCCSLAEAALLLAVNYSRHHEGFSPNRLSDDPKNWKLPLLVSLAKTDGLGIIDNNLAALLIAMNQDRKRIHAGAYIRPDGLIEDIPDIKPEQAESATTTLNALLRKTINWFSLKVSNGAD